MQNLGSTELRLMQGLAQEVTALRPELLNGDATVGELAWVWAKDFDALGRFWRHRLWFANGRLAAWGWAHLPYRVARGDGMSLEVKTANLVWQVHPDRAALLCEILDWYDDVAGGGDRLLTVQSADRQAQTIVAAHGYAFDAEAGSDDGPWVQFNMRELTDVPDPVLPEGFRFLTAEDVPPAAAVKAHRDAWHPSRFTETAFERVRRTWPYRDDLHVLVAAPDGTLAATAIIWLDEATKTAEFEPVGTHGDFRRQGLGTALQLHGMHLARAAGASRMLVACIGAPAHPAARNMYYSVGFRAISRDLPQIKVAR
ncbi:MAG: GNAT family N-acetyltransferase [Mesorhizobium sp.]|uniref:GNAT family N-acetyltransferase n=1 Tax=Mesorhizobium sp. TaxID=1871066 RepID=UPI000FE90947|nr:GNAT family N-acetyltransferase [Mesorhizobium sp.]RWM06020.1 MAG: GNAT family N-acetyltransferase [Mesorhizobium sp.]TIO51887.1 MAG: GNAT family N-acetyltransferase [Mesorhizobium sp.]TIO58915.1 MAG: GNAT family N-acetyltransferase [Mesorhizobium sp.]TJV60801.1 MAG: GNAT family N-acetyltransferase [Mesorhizobium sp.]